MWYENQGLAKNALVSTVKMLFIIGTTWRPPHTPQLHARSHTGQNIPGVLHVDTQTHSHSFKRTHLHVLQPHVALHSSGDKKCSYINVSVMHTVGPNSYIIYKPNHHITTTRFSVLNKDDMNVIQTHMIVFKCLNVILSRSSRRGRLTLSF